MCRYIMNYSVLQKDERKKRMRNYVRAVKVTAVISFISLIIVFVLHYCFKGNETDFWCNVLLSIFGSSLLTALSSFIAYLYEKRITLENFNYSTRSLIHFLSRYDMDWDDEKKIDFLLNYNNLDKTLWDSQLGAICFLHDPNRRKFKYIYDKIYTPILNLNHKISYHEMHFMWHKDGSCRNSIVMHDFIGEIEPLFMRKIVRSFSDTVNGSDHLVTTIKQVLVESILDELNGHYYELLYGKKDTCIAESSEKDNNIGSDD